MTIGNAKLGPRPEDAIAFLRQLCPARDRTLIAMRPRPKQGPEVRFARFPRDNDLECASWIARQNGDGFNLYYALNSTSATTATGITKDSITEVEFLQVDIDPRAGEELESEISRIKRLIFGFSPRPSFIIMSGGGYQGVWRLRDPFAVSNGTALETIEGYNRALELQLGADNTHNINRILRLPGTVNWPDERKVKKGRIARVAELQFAEPEVSYALADFPAPVIIAQHQPAMISVSPQAGAGLEALAGYDLPAWVTVHIEHGDDVALINRRHDEQGWSRAGNPYPSRSEPLYAAVCEMLRHGVPADIVAGILLNPSYGISGSIREKGCNAVRYVQRQIEQAAAHLSATTQGINWPDVDRDGGPRATYKNAYVAIKAYGVVAEHDVFRERLSLGGHSLGNQTEELSDYTLALLRNALIARFGVDFGKQNVADAAIAICVENPVNPVAEYLDSLQWDGEPRLDSWLIDYFGAADTPLNRVVGRKVLLAAVRRIRRPGTPFDLVPVLEGSQGAGKTRALKTLAGEENFSDATVLGLSGREQQEAVAGVWLYELAELANLRKAAIEMTKAFITRTHDRARPAYGRHAIERPRTCVFIGTTNDTAYLEDSTGNRRFLPIKVGSINLVALQRDRDQLWAEAAQPAFEAEALELPAEFYADAARAQAARLVSHPWQDRLHKEPGHLVKGECRIWRSELYEKLSIAAKDQTPATSSALTTVMRAEGWEGPKKMRIFSGQAPQYGFSRPASHRAEEIEPEGDLPPDPMDGIPF